MLLERIVKCSDLQPRQPVRFRSSLADIVCVNSDGVVYAFKNACPHTGYKLHLGKVRGRVITCVSHLAQFDMPSGALISPPVEGQDIPCGVLTVYPVVVEDGYVSVQIPDS